MKTTDVSEKKYDVVILDWGIGGLSVYLEFRKKFSHVSVIYFSDSGYSPYGKLSRKDMKTRLIEVMEKFKKKYGVTHFIVACNAASTALPDLSKTMKQRGYHAIGMIAPTIRWLNERSVRRKSTWFIGGRRTILSRLFQRQSRIQGRIAQPLSALIERGVLSGQEMDQQLEKILRPLHSAKSVILACTHYPAAKHAIQSHLPQAKLINPAFIVLKEIEKNWKKSLQRQRGTHGAVLFFTTGHLAQSTQAAQKAFGVRAVFKSMT